MVFLQIELFYHHYNVLKNRELPFIFVLLKTDYILCSFLKMLYYMIETVSEKTNYFHLCYDKTSNDPVILFDS